MRTTLIIIACITVLFAAGAPVRFSDRAQVEAILREAKARDYGVRSLVQAIVQSDLFQAK